jgi:hypothetical protein
MDVKCGSFTGTALHINMSAVFIIDDPAADEESQSQALCPVAVERLE